MRIMALTLNAQKTAVLVIDMQNAFLDPKGSIARMGISIDRAVACLGIDTLIFTGIATNICVESTVRAAFTRDFRCIVPRQTTASFTPEMEAGSMGNFAFGFAEVVDIDEVYAALGC